MPYDRDLRIETERLVLRPIQAQDFEAWASFMADAEAARHIGGQQVRSVAWRGFLAMASAWEIQGFGMFSVIEKASGRWLGRLGPWMPDGWPGTEVGWGIVRDAWGRGYALEGATAAIDWAFANLGWQEVIHTIAPDNRNSERVAEKLGSRRLREGQLPAPYQNVEIVVWGKTREQWLARRTTIGAS